MRGELVVTCRPGGGGGRSGAVGVDAVPDLREGPDDDAMVVGRVELEEAVEQLLQVVLGVNLLLQNHLQHRLPEVEVRVVGVLLHRHAGPADPAEPLDGAEAADVGVGVGGVAGRGSLHGGGERRGGGGGGVVLPGAGGGVAVAVVAVVARPRLEDGGELRTAAAAAAPQARADRAQNVLLPPA